MRCSQTEAISSHTGKPFQSATTPARRELGRRRGRCGQTDEPDALALAGVIGVVGSGSGVGHDMCSGCRRESVSLRNPRIRMLIRRRSWS